MAEVTSFDIDTDPSVQEQYDVSTPAPPIYREKTLVIKSFPDANGDRQRAEVHFIQEGKEIPPNQHIAGIPQVYVPIARFTEWKNFLLNCLPGHFLFNGDNPKSACMYTGTKHVK